MSDTASSFRGPAALQLRPRLARGMLLLLLPCAQQGHILPSGLVACCAAAPSAPAAQQGLIASAWRPVFLSLPCALSTGMHPPSLTPGTPPAKSNRLNLGFTVNNAAAGRGLLSTWKLRHCCPHGSCGTAVHMEAAALMVCGARAQAPCCMDGQGCMAQAPCCIDGQGCMAPASSGWPPSSTKGRRSWVVVPRLKVQATQARSCTFPAKFLEYVLFKTRPR